MTTKGPTLPKNVVRIASDEQFSFTCHKTVACFTNCCRQLELALTPYDVLRLKQATGLNSRDFLDQYVIVEHEANDAFPRYYLTMVDDGKASCVFLSPQGCTLYSDRPGACRTYPMGRAVVRGQDNSMEEFFVLMRENHCQGFRESQKQTPLEYCADQGLIAYNIFNDRVALILQHDKVRKGLIFSQEQITFFNLACYDLDNFREMIFSGKLPQAEIDEKERQELEDDEKLLIFSLNWLRKVLFDEK